MGSGRPQLRPLKVRGNGQSQDQRETARGDGDKWGKYLNTYEKLPRGPGRQVYTYLLKTPQTSKNRSKIGSHTSKSTQDPLTNAQSGGSPRTPQITPLNPGEWQEGVK